jgi:hypothetical protein
VGERHEVAPALSQRVFHSSEFPQEVEHFLVPETRVTRSVGAVAHAVLRTTCGLQRREWRPAVRRHGTPTQTRPIPAHESRDGTWRQLSKQAARPDPGWTPPSAQRARDRGSCRKLLLNARGRLSGKSYTVSSPALADVRKAASTMPVML